MNEPKENPEFTDIKNQINLDEMDDSQKEFWKLMTTKEDLHPDLVPYLCRSSFGTKSEASTLLRDFLQPSVQRQNQQGYLAKKEYVRKTRSPKGTTLAFLGFTSVRTAWKSCANYSTT
jgi:hypothetical protein